MNNLYYNSKRLRKIRNKRTGRTKKIWGWILTTIGGITTLSVLAELLTGFSDAGDLVSGLIFLIPGLILLGLAKQQVARWDRYEALIDNRGNTSIPMLAERMNLPVKTVYSDLQKMILSDFFIGPNNNIEAYIDGEHDLLVMSSGGKPLEPIPESKPGANPFEEQAGFGQTGGAGAQAQQADPFAQRPGEGNWQDPEDIPDAEWREEPIQVQLTDLEVIQETIAHTSDDEVRNALYGLEGSFRRIDERVQANPELKKKNSIRNLYRYYLPQIMELIRRFRSGEMTPESRQQIRGALMTSAGALANIEADLMEKEQMDIEVDVEVLKNMFARDGLLRSEAAGPQTAKTGSGAQGQSPRSQSRSAVQGAPGVPGAPGQTPQPQSRGAVQGAPGQTPGAQSSGAAQPRPQARP